MTRTKLCWVEAKLELGLRSCRLLLLHSFTPNFPLNHMEMLKLRQRYNTQLIIYNGVKIFQLRKEPAGP